MITCQFTLRNKEPFRWASKRRIDVFISCIMNYFLCFYKLNTVDYQFWDSNMLKTNFHYSNQDIIDIQDLANSILANLSLFPGTLTCSPLKLSLSPGQRSLQRASIRPAPASSVCQQHVPAGPLPAADSPCTSPTRMTVQSAADRPCRPHLQGVQSGR